MRRRVKYSTTRGHTTQTKKTNKIKQNPLYSIYFKKLSINCQSPLLWIHIYTLQYNTCYDYEQEEATARAVVKTTKHDAPSTYHHPPTPPPPPSPPRKPRHAFLFLFFVVNSLCSVSHTAASPFVFGFIHFFLSQACTNHIAVCPLRQRSTFSNRFGFSNAAATLLIVELFVHVASDECDRGDIHVHFESPATRLTTRMEDRERRHAAVRHSGVKDTVMR